MTAAESALQAVNGCCDLLVHLPLPGKDKFPPHLVKMKRTSESRAAHFRKKALKLFFFLPLLSLLKQFSVVTKKKKK